MSLFRRSVTWAPPNAIPPPGMGVPLTGSVRVSNETAMRHSAVWACLRLRADLISTMPVDVYRKVGDTRVSVPPPRVLVNPGGERIGVQEWLYSTQVDLDRSGNCFGVVTERNALGLPNRIDLVELGQVSVRSTIDGDIEYRIAGKQYPARDIWHERQFTIAGLAVGLSPIAYAAWSIGSYLSAQDFALDWFGHSAIPAAELTNTAKTLTPEQAAEVKQRYRATVSAGDVFVHGSDWELKPIQSVASQTQYIELMKYGIPDISRFFGCPADLIDGAVSGQAVTYANITQRNLQLLTMNIGPAVLRRESALSGLVPAPRFVKLNRSALLAMDPQTRANTLRVQLDSRQIAPSEARAIEDRPPFTSDQLAEIDRVYGSPRTQPTGATA